jgi:hypothetical protein
MKLHWVHFSLFMIFLLAAGQLSAQQTTKALKVHHAQLTPHFLQKIQDQGDQVTDFTISVHSYEAFLEKIESLGLQKAVKKNYPNINTVVLSLKPEQLIQQILPMKEVRFVDKTQRIPQEERAVPGFDLGVNHVNFVHHSLPEWNGSGINISVKEQSMDSLDIDFAGRFISSNNPIPGLSTHATTMASMIAGAGNSSPAGKGVAWQAGLTSTSFLNIFPESDAYYQNYNLSIQNHSYGLGIENFYGAEAAGYDDHIYRNDHMVHVFSAGNIGDSTSTEGPYAGLPGFANLTGTFKMSKNVLTVGSVDANLAIQSRSSRGPAYDGRVKPELMALGQDGSSGAAAITSGVAALLQQAYFEQNGSLPSAGLIRAVLLNSADDLHTEGPDFLSGFGNVNAQKALATIDEQRFFSGTVGQGELVPFSIEVPENAQHLKITLAWIDPPATVNASRALINDLDLNLIESESKTRFLPWVPDHQPNISSLSMAATRGKDRLNNQEQISIASPLPGNYLIEVIGHELGQGPQTFFLAYEWERAEEVAFSSPTRSDVMPAAENNFIRWSGISSLPGSLSYRLIGNEEWTLIDEPINTADHLLRWTTPDTTALAQLRMEYGGKAVLSDTFVISREPDIELSIDCDDFIRLQWGSIPGAERYQVFSFDGNQLLPFAEVNETSITVQKAINPSEYFAVAPLLSGRQLGKRSNSLFLPFQSAGCYINNFLADLVDERARLTLELGTFEGVESIQFQKKTDGLFQTIATLENSTQLTLIEFDQQLEIGRNIYRAVVTISSEQALLSGEDDVFYLLPDQFLFYPNPISQEENIQIAIKNPGGEIIELYDELGRLVIRYDLINPFETLETINLPAGIYFYHILREEERIQEGKIIIK